MTASRIGCDCLRAKVMPADAAAELIASHSTVGMSGFTGSGYPKSVPMALARRIEAEHAAGRPFRLRVWTGASTGPELDGALARADGIEFRLPYNSDPIAPTPRSFRTGCLICSRRADCASRRRPPSRSAQRRRRGSTPTWRAFRQPHRAPPTEDQQPSRADSSARLPRDEWPEADIYGNVNSTHIMGSRIQNGIGGSGDFARNAYVFIFMTPSTAKGGKISSIVPQASHVDHVTQDVQVLVTEQGLADLRGLSPKQRAELIIANCAHPDYRPLLADYYRRAKAGSYGQQSPSLPGEALSWHQHFLDTGSMLVGGLGISRG